MTGSVSWLDPDHDDGWWEEDDDEDGEGQLALFDADGKL